MTNFLETDKFNMAAESRALVTKAEDAMTTMGKLTSMLTKERKTRLKRTFSKSYQNLYDQDFSQTVHLLGNKNSQKPNCDTFWKLQFLKDKKKQGKQQVVSPSSRTSSESLNYQGRKKNFSGPQYQQPKQSRRNSFHKHLRQRQQKISKLFDQSLLPSLNQSKKR